MRRPPEPPAPPLDWRPSLRNPPLPPPRGNRDRDSHSRHSELPREEVAFEVDRRNQSSSRQGDRSRPHDLSVRRASSTTQEGTHRRGKGASKGNEVSLAKGGGKGEGKRKKKNKGLKRSGWWQKYLERKNQRGADPSGTAAEEAAAEAEAEEVNSEEVEEAGGGAAEVAQRLERWADVEETGGEGES